MTDLMQAPTLAGGATLPSAADAGRFDAFISYARCDLAAARQLRAVLHLHQHLVWIDVEGILAGTEWQARIIGAIEACTAFVFLISPDWLRSENCARELREAYGLNKLIIAVELESSEGTALPPELAACPLIAFDDVDSLIEALRTDSGWREQHTRLAARTREWDQAGRDSSFLLRGRDLRDAERWLGGQSEHRQAPTYRHAEYIHASRRAATTRRRRLAGVALAAIVILLAFALTQRSRVEALSAGQLRPPALLVTVPAQCTAGSKSERLRKRPRPGSDTTWPSA